ncbi:cytochrome c oxidase subunit II [Lentisphaera profundi]|uniref:Cytochrome c oxidase subunit 2 n=1 Tax=Lentisphaera profundi TaxID=1658616 RepID=A0ABY7VUM9_9BACT|nr:cytochrome c oxidase subunit II [Lentisphaera profundi]WDE96597.1 cytochrome c oxidase subunit II [Lentisphaera profundi]
MKLDNIFRYSEAASAHAKEVDSVGSLINWLSVVFFVLIIGLMLYFMIRYRRRSENEKTPHITHNLLLEIAWSVIPLAIILVFFVRGYKTFINVMQPAPYAQSEDIYVTGSMWNWKFEFDNGGSVSSISSVALSPLKIAKAERKNLQKKDALTDVESKNLTKLNELIVKLENDPKVNNLSYYSKNAENFTKDGLPFISPKILTVPVDTPIRLVVTSKDVLHSFAIPAMRVKRDAVPGQKREFMFTPIKEGVYYYTCNEMCGTDHAFMIGWMNVVSKEEYAKFKEAITPIEGGTPAEQGERFWAKNCMACHAVKPNAPKGIGPNWYGLWGKERTFTDGSKAMADHQYISEAINDPAKKIVQGYAAMPAQGTFKDRDIKNLIEFIKTLSDKPSEPSEEAEK